MKKNIYQLLLTVTFLLRIMVPIGNAAYLMCMVSTGKNTGWTAVFVVAILLEVAVMLAAGAGLQSPEARRWGGIRHVCSCNHPFYGLHAALRVPSCL